MRKTLPLLLVSALTLSACGNGSSADADLLKNPLYAEFYYDDLVETMVQIQLNDPEAVEADGDLSKILEDVRQNGLAQSRKANDAQDGGTRGILVEVTIFAQGEALLVNDTLYFGPDFGVASGPSLRLFLTKAVDPREPGAFPAADDIEIGALRTPYGAQQYAVPEADPAAYRTLVIYDTKLKKLYAFAQLAE